MLGPAQLNYKYVMGIEVSFESLRARGGVKVDIRLKGCAEVQLRAAQSSARGG